MLHTIPITKGKEDLEVESKDLSDDVSIATFAEGLKVLLNKGMTKVTAKDYPDEDERRAAAMEIARANLQKLLDGEVPSRRKKKAKESGKVMTEARRLAKEAVKEGLRKAKKKISHFKASDITAAANALLETEKGKSFIEKARANIAAAEAEEVDESILEGLEPDESLVEKAAEAAEARKKISAKSPKARPNA